MLDAEAHHTIQLDGAGPAPVRILDFSEGAQGRKIELVEACDFMGIKSKNSSWNHGFRV